MNLSSLYLSYVIDMVTRRINLFSNKTGCSCSIQHTHKIQFIHYFGKEVDNIFGSLVYVFMMDLDSLEVLRAPTNCLSPFHSTLKHLELMEGIWRRKWIDPSLVFALHHLPKLEIIQRIPLNKWGNLNPHRLLST